MECSPQHSQRMDRMEQVGKPDEAPGASPSRTRSGKAEVAPPAEPLCKPEVAPQAEPRAGRIALPERARALMAALGEEGFEAWAVGGFVRDALIGRPASDVDVACSAPWEQTARIVEARGWKAIPTGAAHGTVTCVVEGVPFEVTTFRVDGGYSDGRHPDEVSPARTIEEDLARRDFTVNAMAYHPERGLRDPFGGQADLRDGVIRAVGEPNARFTEDALRILRALRFASELGFRVEPLTAAALSAKSLGLGRISAERIASELTRLLCGKDAARILRDHERIICQAIPELAPMVGLRQRTPYHRYDVYEHTLRAVAATAPEPLDRWCALLHDVGKPSSYFTDEAGVGHFYGHPKVSAEMARTILERLRMPRRLIEDAVLIVRYHDAEIDPTDAAVKRMLRRLDGRLDLFEALCRMKRADARAQAAHCAVRGEYAEALAERARRICAQREPLAVRDLAVNGRDLIALGIEPGPRLGSLLDRLLDEVVGGALPSDREALLARAEELIKETDE